MEMTCFFDLATPDPEFSGLTAENDDQLPGRPTEGRLEISTIFESLKLLVTNEQQEGSVNGETIFDHLRDTGALVLGPNVGQLLHDNQHIIPVELRGEVVLVFWGTVYRDSDRRRLVRCLYWDDDQWAWSCDWIDDDRWHANFRAVVLARKP